MKRLVTSEAVTEGHPDKIADQISDAVLDAALKLNPNSRVAIETMVTPGLVHIGGELTTDGWIDFRQVAKETLAKIGDSQHLGLPEDTVAVMPTVIEQSHEISKAVTESNDDKTTGAGDQGMMYGYAVNETKTLMPLPITLANEIAFELSQARKTRMIPNLRPDAKVQVTVEYDGLKAVKVDTILVSTQHDKEWDMKLTAEEVKQFVIKPILMQHAMPQDYKFMFNPSGSFVTGGVMADSGLTGRKIIADTYGGAARHGGGAFSGKDATKVDRSAAYAMRWVAKNVVALGLADKVEIQVAYAIGMAEPVGLYVDSFGTGKEPDDKIASAILQAVDLRPRAIIESLDLKQPIFSDTTCYGHFGKEQMTWEKPDLADSIERAL